MVFFVYKGVYIIIIDLEKVILYLIEVVNINLLKRFEG